MTGWVVRCQEHTSAPQKTLDAAMALLHQIEDNGLCGHEHRVEPV